MSTEPQTLTLPEFSFAFQPIVDVVEREIVSYEALIRGLGMQPAYQILQQVPVSAMHTFDQGARVKAIQLASRLGLDRQLNLNFLPQGLDASAVAILTTIEAAEGAHLSLEQVVLEVTEGEIIDDQAQFATLINEYRGLGVKVSIDDFGAGYSGLNLLADFQPDQIKLDMKLIRGIDRSGPRQAIVRAIVQVSDDLGIDVLAEGVESVAEYRWLANQGIRLFQGYLFAKPAFEVLPEALFPDLS